MFLEKTLDKTFLVFWSYPWTKQYTSWLLVNMLSYYHYYVCLYFVIVIVILHVVLKYIKTKTKLHCWDSAGKQGWQTWYSKKRKKVWADSSLSLSIFWAKNYSPWVWGLCLPKRCLALRLTTDCNLGCVCFVKVWCN